MGKSDAAAGLQSAQEILKWYAKEYGAPSEATNYSSTSHPPREHCSPSGPREAALPKVEPSVSVLEPEYVEDAPVSAEVERVLPLARQVFILAARAISSGREVGEPFETTARALTLCKARISAAEEPFRLGVVGDSRAGKSTLINAIIGDNLAFTSVVEATPVACSFRRGEARAARIFYRDGMVEESTVEAANQVLDDRRHDVAWIETIDHIEFSTVKESLGDLELWDAPGFGGSDHNDVTASEFLRKIGGAVWVFDCQFLGAVSHIAPLQILQEASKKVLGVINKVDYLDEELYPLALEESLQRYGDLVEDFALISATNAYARTQRDARDPMLDKLLEKLKTTILDSAVSDRQDRVLAAIRTGARDLSSEIDREQRSLSDRLGFVSHIEQNLHSAYLHVIAELDGLLNRACSTIFSRQQEAAQVELGQLYSASRERSQKELEKGFAQIMERLEADTPLPWLIGPCPRSSSTSFVPCGIESVSMQCGYPQLPYPI